MGGVPLLPPKYDSQKTNDFDEIITGNNSTPTKKLIKAQIKRISSIAARKPLMAKLLQLRLLHLVWQQRRIPRESLALEIASKCPWPTWTTRSASAPIISVHDLIFHPNVSVSFLTSCVMESDKIRLPSMMTVTSSSPMKPLISLIPCLIFSESEW